MSGMTAQAGEGIGAAKEKVMAGISKAKLPLLEKYSMQLSQLSKAPYDIDNIIGLKQSLIKDAAAFSPDVPEGVISAIINQMPGNELMGMMLKGSRAAELPASTYKDILKLVKLDMGVTPFKKVADQEQYFTKLAAKRVADASYENL